MASALEKKIKRLLNAASVPEIPRGDDVDPREAVLAKNEQRRIFREVAQETGATIQMVRRIHKRSLDPDKTRADRKNEIKRRLSLLEKPGLLEYQALAKEFSVTVRRIRQIDQEQFDPNAAPEIKKPKATTESLVNERLTHLYDNVEDVDLEAIAAEFRTTVGYVRKLDAVFRRKLFAGVKLPITENQTLMMVDLLRELGTVYSEDSLRKALAKLTKRQASAVIKNLFNLVKTRRCLHSHFGRMLIIPLLKQVDFKLFGRK